MVLCDGLLPLQSNILSHQGSKMLTDREKVRYTGRRGDRQDFGMIYLNIYLFICQIKVFLISLLCQYFLLFYYWLL